MTPNEQDNMARTLMMRNKWERPHGNFRCLSSVSLHRRLSTGHEEEEEEEKEETYRWRYQS
jgi:hypothetical protein